MEMVLRIKAILTLIFNYVDPFTEHLCSQVIAALS